MNHFLILLVFSLLVLYRGLLISCSNMLPVFFMTSGVNLKTAIATSHFFRTYMYASSELGAVYFNFISNNSISKRVLISSAAVRRKFLTVERLPQVRFRYWARSICAVWRVSGLRVWN